MTEVIDGYKGEEVESKPEYQFNIDEMAVTSKLLQAHQEGNYLVGVTDMGIKFKQRIPVDKMLSKNEKGEWCLVPLRGNI